MFDRDNDITKALHTLHTSSRDFLSSFVPSMQALRWRSGELMILLIVESLKLLQFENICY